MTLDIRSHQRYSYFRTAYTRFASVVDIRDMSELEEAWLVQMFEFTLELAWKTMRDFLTEEGFSVGSPKETMRQAFESGYIEDAQVWIDMIDVRNRFSHDYDGHFFHEKEYFLRTDAFSALGELISFFEKKL